MWNRLKALAVNNDVYLFSISESEEDKEYENQIKTILKGVKLYPRRKNISTLLRSLMIPYPCVSRWNKNLKLDLEKMFRDINPDFIIVELPQMIGILPDSIKKSGKIILEQHNIEYRALKSISIGDEPFLKKLAYRIVSYQMKRYEENIYKRNFIKIFTFVSREEKKFFEDKYSLNNTILQPIGANIKEYPKIINSHNIIFVAKMSYQPNEDAALFLIKKVFPIIKDKIQDAKLYLVGKDPSDMLMSYSNKNIIVTGTVDNLEDYYNLADLAVVPIMTGGGVNVKLIEALGHGKFVVTTTKGIEGTNFISGEDVFVADNYEMFANMCIGILNSPSDYEPVRKNGYSKLVHGYSWTKICNDFEEYLEKMTHNSR